MEIGDVMLLGSQKGDNRLLKALAVKLSGISKEVSETARMYLLTGGNSVQAAQLLYVHRNTFTYRLAKFIDQTRIDLREPGNAYVLHIYFTLEQSIS
jgi:DNA-binding PucR family transcriptional regulator